MPRYSFLMPTLLLFALLLGTATVSARQLRVEVRELKVACSEGAPASCLQVKFPGSKDWEVFRGEIKGFDYQPGYRYTLLVDGAGAPGKPEYVLQRIVAQERVLAEQVHVAGSGGGLMHARWMLTEIYERPVGNVVAYLELEGANFSGSGGCNRIFGKMKHDAEKSGISFGMVAGSLMACSGRAATLEDSFMRTISEKTFRYRLSGNTLVLTDNDYPVLKFARSAVIGQQAGSPEVAESIYRYGWKLVTINGKGAVGRDAHFRFDNVNSRVNGNTGCNNFFGNVERKEDRLKFATMATTRMACTDEKTTAQEREILRILNGQTLQFSVSGETLSLSNGKSRVMEFVMDRGAAEPHDGTGLRGVVIRVEGNHMPSPVNHAGTQRPAMREVVVYELTTGKQAVSEGGVFYKDLSTKRVASVMPDEAGNYFVNLEPGTYSVFINEEGRLFANRSDGSGNINPVRIEAGKVTKLDISIDYQAAY